MCQPTSNKDSDQDVYSSQNSGSSFASSFDIEPSLTSRAMNLRDMMRRAAASTQRYVGSLKTYSIMLKKHATSLTVHIVWLCNDGLNCLKVSRSQNKIVEL